MGAELTERLSDQGYAVVVIARRAESGGVSSLGDVCILYVLLLFWEVLGSRVTEF